MKWTVAIVALLLAGCSESPTTPETTGPIETQEEEPPAPVVESIVAPFQWRSALVAGAWACDGAATQDCYAAPEAAYSADHAIDLAAGNLTAGNATVTWTAVYPTTESITFGMGVRLADGSRPWAAEWSGESPLETNLPALELGQGATLQLWAYGGVINGAGPVYAGVSTDQPFLVEGVVEVQDA